MTPEAPLVGAVTTLPKDAFSSFTANAKLLTQVRISGKLRELDLRYETRLFSESMDEFCDSSFINPGARLIKLTPPGKIPSVKHPFNILDFITSQMCSKSLCTSFPPFSFPAHPYAFGIIPKTFAMEKHEWTMLFP